MHLSMNTSKSGITAHQRALDAISHNIANANTDGYKAKTFRFQSLINQTVTEEDAVLSEAAGQIGYNAGVRGEVGGTNPQQGSFAQGMNQLQLGIAGEGFFGVEDANGEFYLTRDGSFTRDGNGQLVNGSGDRLVWNNALPADQWPDGRLSVSEDGSLFVQGEQGGMQVGTIPLFLPENAQQLQPAGGNKYIVPEGQAAVFNDGSIQQQTIELSNVDLAQELTNMMVTQRAYSLNVKVAQTTDEWMTMINQFNH